MKFILGTTEDGFWVLCNYNLENPSIDCKLKILKTEELKKEYTEEDITNFDFLAGVMRSSQPISSFKEYTFDVGHSVTDSIVIKNTEKVFGDLIDKNIKEINTLENSNLSNINLSLNNGSVTLPFLTGESWRTATLIKYNSLAEAFKGVKLKNQIDGSESSIPNNIKITTLTKDQFNVIFSGELLGYLLRTNKELEQAEQVVKALNSVLSAKVPQQKKIVKEREVKREPKYFNYSFQYDKPTHYTEIRDVIESYGLKREFLERELGGDITELIVETLSEYKTNGVLRNIRKSSLFYERLWLIELLYCMHIYSDIIPDVMTVNSSVFTFSYEKLRYDI